MFDYFRDKLSALDNSIDEKGKAIGAWDIHSKQYVLSLQPFYGTYSTSTFDDNVNGFTSFFGYKPDNGGSIKNQYYTVKDGVLWLHYASDAKRSNFYGTQQNSSIEFVFNPKASMSKVFKTVNYEGGNGWQVDSFKSGITGVASVGTPINADNDVYNIGTKDTTALIYSYNQGSYDNYGNQYPALLTPPINHAGFTRKENKYMANLINNSPAAAGEVMFGADMTGIKGYFATVKLSTDTVTDLGGMKELYAVSSNYVESSY